MPQYQEDIAVEQLALKDKVLIMMDERHFLYWMSKPKNGCVEAEEARAEFQRLAKRPGAVKDKKGKCEK